MPLALMLGSNGPGRLLVAVGLVILLVRLYRHPAEPTLLFRTGPTPNPRLIRSRMGPI
jgi:hypothetical protein